VARRTERTIDRASADFSSFCERSPRWMSRVYHLFRITGVLNDMVGIGAGLVADLWPATWLMIRHPPEGILRLLRWEAYFGKEAVRVQYNANGLDLARRTRRTQVTSFRGMIDFFVPVVSKKRADAVLVSGPFRRRTPTAPEIVEQWTDLSSTVIDPYDPTLAAYTRDALEVPVLPERGVEPFTELLEILTRAVVDEEQLPRDLERVAYLRERIFGRMPRSRQKKAGMMLDPIVGHRWHELVQNAWEVAELGIEHMPNTVVAVMPSVGETTTSGVVASLVAARYFQNRCAELSARLADTLTSPLESYGTYFLFYVPAQRNAARRRMLVTEHARQIAELLRRERFRVAIGIGNVAEGDLELPECARRATIALQLAVHQGQPWMAYDDVPGEWHASAVGSAPMSHLTSLVDIFREGAFAPLETRHADYVRAVLLDSGGRSDVVRTHFECAADALLGVVRQHRTVSDRTLLDLRTRLRSTLARADTIPALAAALHDALEVLSDLERKPGPVELELKLARAARYIEEHCREPLTLAGTARQVQLSRNYFSSRFKEAYASGFTEYVTRVRINRAKHLLSTSSLKISRIGEESGFASVPHFNRVFKKKVGVTPSRFRARGREGVAVEK
jgi:AraC-like DNA-binding protein